MCRWLAKSVVKSLGSTWELQSILMSSSSVEGDGIPGVAVKCVDIGRNIDGEGNHLGLTDTVTRKRG